MNLFFARTSARRIRNPLDQFGKDAWKNELIAIPLHFVLSARESMSAAFTYRPRGATASNSSR